MLIRFICHLMLHQKTLSFEYAIRKTDLTKWKEYLSVEHQIEKKIILISHWKLALVIWARYPKIHHLSITSENALFHRHIRTRFIYRLPHIKITWMLDFKIKWTHHQEENSLSISHIRKNTPGTHVGLLFHYFLIKETVYALRKATYSWKRGLCVLRNEKTYSNMKTRHQLFVSWKQNILRYFGGKW